MIDIKSLTLPALEEIFVGAGEKPYRARQVYAWLHRRLVGSFDEMTDLPLGTRAWLAGQFELPFFELRQVLESRLDGTRKYLFALPAGASETREAGAVALIESVMMEYRHGRSVCISSQLGCRMGCLFCASAAGGFERSLSAAEMLEQVYAIERDLAQTGGRVSNVVVMGVGEPLENPEGLVDFVRILSDKRGLNIGQRHISVSTCGLVPAIYRLADEALQINLAVSLHAADDALRRHLMPVAAAYPLSELITACRHYFNRCGRRISFEYSLIGGVNDGVGDAQALAALLSDFRPVHVNLIAVNPVPGRGFYPPPPAVVADFKKILEKNQINVTIRREMGRDIEGACGQLRAIAE